MRRQLPRWTHIPPDARNDLSDAYNAWHTVYEVTLKPCAPQEKAPDAV